MLGYPPSHRSVDEPQPEWCALCGLRVGGRHIEIATAEGIEGQPVCDVTPSCRELRHALSGEQRRGRSFPALGNERVFTPGASQPFEWEGLVEE